MRIQKPIPKRKPVRDARVAGLVLLVSLAPTAASAASQTFDGYSINWDGGNLSFLQLADTTSGAQAPDFSVGGSVYSVASFNWLHGYGVSGSAVSQVLPLPGFTVTAAPGWLISDVAYSFNGSFRTSGGAVRKVEDAQAAWTTPPPGGITYAPVTDLGVSTPGVWQLSGTFSHPGSAGFDLDLSHTVRLSSGLNGSANFDFAPNVVGTGAESNQYLAVTVTRVAAPVPEPPAGMMMLGGLALVGVIVHRRSGS